MSWDNPQNLEDAMRLADTLSKSSLIAEDLKNTNNMLLLMGTANSLGISIFVGIRTMNVINGKAILGADGMAAVVRRSNLVEKLDVIESSERRCVVRAQRVGGEPFEIVWDWDMAVKAGLTTKRRFNKELRRYEVVAAETYEKYPRQMLRARALSETCRLGWPDVVGGVYDPDEIQSTQLAVELEPKPAPSVIRSEPEPAQAPKVIQPEPAQAPKVIQPEPAQAPKVIQPEPGPEPEPKPEKKTKEQEEAQAFKQLAAEFINTLKERGLEDAHERLLAGYVRRVTKDQRYTGKKPGDVKDFDILSSVYEELWSISRPKPEDDHLRNQDSFEDPADPDHHDSQSESFVDHQPGAYQ